MYSKKWETLYAFNGYTMFISSGKHFGNNVMKKLLFSRKKSPGCQVYFIE